MTTVTLRRLLCGLLPCLLALLTQAALAQGVPGVRAEYFNFTGNPPAAIPATGAVVDRVETNINTLRSTLAPAPGIGATNHLVRYTGSMLLPATGAYTFQVEADDGVRLFVDCNGNGAFSGVERLIDQWVDQATTTYQASCPNGFPAGTQVLFRVEFFQRNGEHSLRMSWAGPAPVGGTQSVIPQGTGTQGFYSGVVDSTRPTISSAALACGATNQILVIFSEALDSVSAQTLSNYSVSGGHTITGATLTGDRTAVALTLSPSLTTTRTLTVNNVRDLAGNSVAVNSTASLPFAPTTIAPGLTGNYFSQNGVARAYFGGSSVQRIDNTVDFDWGGGTPGVMGIGADDFTVRWTGLIRIPTTGTYSFRTSSDDGVRLYINASTVIDNWTDHGPTLDTSGGIAFTAGSYVPVTLEFFERGGGATIRLQWATPSSGGAYAAIPASQLFQCVPAAIATFTISGTGAASTCTPKTLTITARNSNGAPVTTYTGTANLTTSTGRGTWTPGSAVVPQGSLTPGAANSGNATYQFAVADGGVVQLGLSHSLAQNVMVTVVDNTVSGSSAMSAAINFSDNAFVWAEDLSNAIAGSNIVVAGRNHDMQVSLIKKDTSTGSCGVATDFAGTRNLKLWRTDTSGPWTAPSVVSPALSVPAIRPASNNLSLSFTAGVASLNLGTTDIGKYALNLDDDSLTYAGTTVSGSQGDLTVRPFAIVVSAITSAGTVNPAGSTATDAVFGKAGASFSATVAAYRFSASADNGAGLPTASATLAQTTAGGLTASYNTAVALTPLAGSQTPSGAGTVLGSLGNGVVSGFSSGTVTVGNLTYSEVGSFLLNTSAVVGNYLGTAGLSLDAAVFRAGGTQSNRVGRFVPAGFARSGTAVTHRSALSCSPASTFSYLDENFNVGFTLTAQNAVGGTTQNYTGSFAKLDLSAPTGFNLAGIAGTVLFKNGGRLLASASSGTWGSGVTSGLVLTAMARRSASGPDGPFDTAQFGIAPVDSDNVTMLSPDLDTDSPGNGVDASLLGTIPLRYGRLRLQNALGAAGRALNLALTAQHWNGSAYNTNPLDACSRINASHLNFSNLRKQLTPADLTMSPISVTVNPTTPAFIRLSAPAGNRVGSVDVGVALGATGADASCIGATPAKAATAGANLLALRGAWCGANAVNDPSARATWGLYRGADGMIYQRENY